MNETLSRLSDVEHNLFLFFNKMSTQSLVANFPDADLVPTNVKDGIDIFWVLWTYEWSVLIPAQSLLLWTNYWITQYSWQIVSAYTCLYNWKFYIIDKWRSDTYEVQRRIREWNPTTAAFTLRNWWTRRADGIQNASEWCSSVKQNWNLLYFMWPQYVPWFPDPQYITTFNLDTFSSVWTVAAWCNDCDMTCFNTHIWNYISNTVVDSWKTYSFTAQQFTWGGSNVTTIYKLNVS